MMFCNAMRAACTSARSAKPALSRRPGPAHRAAGQRVAGPAARSRAPARGSATVMAVMVAASLAAWSTAAWAQPEPALAEVPLARLQSMVLACDLKAPARAPATAATAFCTAAADELRRRAFGGSRERLLAWWQALRTGQPGAPAAAPSTRRPGTPAAAGRPAASAASSTPVNATSMRLQDATPAQLKAAYLQCNRLAETTLLDFGTAATCSMVYEALKERVFGGDFQRLLRWSREQRAGATAATVATGAGH